ncbi:MAG: hypothetical protein IJ137_05090, partial [Eubacterium sp.]|nr:hypothetical protein [Eubacterium sp.]
LLASDEQELIFLTDGTEYAHVGFNVYNPSDNAVKIGESYVCGIIVNARTDFGFVTSKGINLSSGADEVKSAFGTPYKIDQYDNYDVLLYSAGELSEGSAYFYCYDNNESNSISMKHKPKDFRVEVEVSEDKPDYLSSYKAPDKLPDKATETIFQLDGKLYQLPCPLGEFTDAGWEVAGRNVNSVGGYKSETSCIKIAKDGYSIDLDMTNFDPTARTTENCAVSGIRVTNRHKDTDMQGDYMKFSGGINVSMEADEAEDKLEGFDKSDSSSYVSFRYSSDDYSKTIHYMWSVYGNFDLSNKKWNY